MRTPRGRTSRRRAGRSRWHWLLLVAIVLPLWTPLFNRLDPTLFGMPFFYWGPLSMVGVSMVVLAIVHMLSKNAGGG